METPQFTLAAQTATKLSDTSYWVCPAKQSVYAIYLYSPYAFPNSQYPYQLRVWNYAPSASFYADAQQWLGGIAIDGTIALTEMSNGWKGVMVDDNTIVWNDNSVWKRSSKPQETQRNPFSARSAYEQAVQYSSYINGIYNRAYPNLYKFNPY